jgi:tight adherence protein C
MTDWTPLVVAALAFCAMGGVAYVVGQYYVQANRLSRRLPVIQGAAGDSASAASAATGLVARHFDEKRFGIDDTVRGQLRANLIRAGYFRKDAINYYVLWRLAAAALFPLVAYLVLLIVAPNISFVRSAIVIVVAMGLGVLGPDGFVSRRQRLLSDGYRAIFPDFLDLLVVCVDAGLSLEGAIERITDEIGRRDKYFGINLAILGAEMRVGRSFVEALGTLADRLMILEAHALVAVLRQSSELGANVGEALGIFGDELRDKRLLRAEEQANKLSVKMLLPLTLFIFPVVVGVVILPLILKLITVFGK